MTVRTRYAPSPTGSLHIGNVRSGLFAYLFARHNGGRFILRIDDTDQERSTKESLEEIVASLRMARNRMGRGTARSTATFQSNRFDRYREAALPVCCARARPIPAIARRRNSRPSAGRPSAKSASPATTAPAATSRTRRTCSCPTGRAGRNYTIRFRSPQEGQTVVDDLVKGHAVFQNSELDDLIIFRSDGVPTYNFATVLDDADFGITHVVRGDDHLPNTPAPDADLPARWD